MNVLVNGTGNIGTTLTNLLVHFKTALDIEVITIHKNLPEKWLETDVEILAALGVNICTSDSKDKYRNLSDVISDIHYIFECTADGVGMRGLEFYKHLPNLVGACSQGSENGFGTAFMSGVNPDAVKDRKFVRIVSCNTHSTASILHTLGGEILENLEKADIVAVRRSEDIGSHRRLVGANVVSRHLNGQTGTHHGTDVVQLFKSIGIEVDLTTSDITTPSQLMHGARFNIDLKQNINLAEIKNLISGNRYVSTTAKFDSNAVFELGRRYGFQGRIFSHCIVVVNNLLVSRNNVKGWMFVPQEGNTIISTIEAFLLQTGSENRVKVLDLICAELLRKEW